MEELIGKAGKLRFFLDMDSGILAASIAAFRGRYLAGDADAFYVKILKEMSIDAKKKAISISQEPLIKFMNDNPTLSRPEARHALLVANLLKQFPEGRFGGSWIRHPFPNMSEPNKQIQYCTDQGAYEVNHLATLLLKASLHAIDKYFMLVRRRINIFERPIHSSNSGTRVWYGYQGYNPAIGAKLLEIFRVFYNCMKPGDDKKTPAMRLGISDRPASYSEVLNFVP